MDLNKLFESAFDHSEYFPDHDEDKDIEDLVNDPELSNMIEVKLSTMLYDVEKLLGHVGRGVDIPKWVMDKIHAFSNDLSQVVSVMDDSSPDLEQSGQDLGLDLSNSEDSPMGFDLSPDYGDDSAD